MSTTERTERANRLCRRLAGDVAAIAPAGLGTWDRAWEIVDPPSAELLAALTAWEATGDEEAVAAVKAAYDAVLAAWREAARQYREVAR